MERFMGLTATGWTAVYTLLTFGLLAVAVAAALYARKQWNTAQGTRQDSIDASREATRPYVLVSIEPSRVGTHIQDLVVRNIGVRPAIATRVTIDPTPVRAQESDGWELAETKMLTEPIELLAPGQEMRTFFDVPQERKGREDLPASYRASVAYTDTSGHPYSGQMTLDLEALKGTSEVTIRTMHDLASAVMEIQKRLNSAGLLDRHTEVAAVVEGRPEHVQRLSDERAEQVAHYEEMKRRMLPNQSAE